MHVDNKPYTTIWLNYDQRGVSIIDQTLLPHRFEIVALHSLDEFCHAISAMQVRGAPLIGITAAFGLALSIAEHGLDSAYRQLLATRPTAVNLRWALEQVRASVEQLEIAAQPAAALAKAQQLRGDDIAACEAIGDNGADLLEQLYRDKHEPEQLNLLTHCNAGWLATVDWGTALAPIYKGFERGLPIHVWVDETRPRNQGASLTAWELQQHGIPHTVIADNTGGHLMQQGLVDACLVGSDRTSANGDVCNKIGSYLKALAAFDNNIPFYVALPCSTIDWTIDNGVRDIPIEQRDEREVTHIQGLSAEGQLQEVQLVADSPAANYAFDVTPARLVSGLITECGVVAAEASAMQAIKPR